MLAHENDGDLRGKAAKGRCIWGREGDVVPCSGVSKTRLTEEKVSEGGKGERIHIPCLWSATCCWTEGYRCIEEGGYLVSSVQSRCQCQWDRKKASMLSPDRN